MPGFWSSRLRMDFRDGSVVFVREVNYKSKLRNRLWGKDRHGESAGFPRPPSGPG